MTIFSGWITTTKCGWDWGAPLFVASFRIKRPGAPLAAARRDLPRRIPIVDTLWPAPRKQSNCESFTPSIGGSPPQRGIQLANTASRSDFWSGWYPLHLSPEASSHRDSFFAATAPSFTMLRIIWYAPSSQGCSRRHFRPEPFPPTTAFTHLESSGPFRRNGHNDAQSNRQRGKPGWFDKKDNAGRNR